LKRILPLEIDFTYNEEFFFLCEVYFIGFRGDDLECTIQSIHEYLSESGAGLKGDGHSSEEEVVREVDILFFVHEEEYLLEVVLVVVECFEFF